MGTVSRVHTSLALPSQCEHLPLSRESGLHAVTPMSRSREGKAGHTALAAVQALSPTTVCVDVLYPHLGRVRASADAPPIHAPSTEKTAGEPTLRVALRTSGGLPDTVKVTESAVRTVTDRETWRLDTRMPRSTERPQGCSPDTDEAHGLSPSVLHAPRSQTHKRAVAGARVVTRQRRLSAQRSIPGP